MTEYVANEDCDLISVIVPAYNEEKSMKKCLEMLTNQTYKNLEIIVVYLQSPDKTLEIIKSFHDDRIKIIEQTEQTGPGGARNIGLDAVSGSYIGFFEADAHIPFDYYEKLHKAAVESGSDIAMCEVVQVFGGKGKYYSKVEKDCVIEKLIDKLDVMRHGTTFDKLYKTELIQEHHLRFPLNWRFEDNPWLLRAFYYANSIRQIKGLFYVYFLDAYTESYAQILNKSVTPIAQDMYNFALEQDFSAKELKQVKRVIMRSFANARLLNKDVYYPLKKAIDGGLWMEKRRFRLFRQNIKNKIGEILCRKKS